MSIAFSLLPHCATAYASRACRFLCNFDVGIVRFSNPPTIEVFNFTLLVEKKIENKSVYAKKRKRKMEEIVTYETLLFALVNFSIARLIVNLNRGANLAWISANYFLAAWPLSVIFYFFFFLFFSQRCTLRSITEQRY